MASGRWLRRAASAEPGATPASAEMTSTSVAGTVMLWGAPVLSTRACRRGNDFSIGSGCPAQRRGDPGGDQFERAECLVRWRIHGVDLQDQVGRAREQGISAQAGNDVVWRADVNV